MLRTPTFVGLEHLYAIFGHLDSVAVSAVGPRNVEGDLTACLFALCSLVDNMCGFAAPDGKEGMRAKWVHRAVGYVHFVRAKLLFANLV